MAATRIVSTMSAATSIGRKFNASLQQTMLRVRNPEASIKFYEQHFGLKLVHKYTFPDWKFDLYFMERPRDADVASLPKPGTAEAEKYLWSMPGTTLELTYNYESEKGPPMWSGNEGSDLPSDSPLYREGVVRGFGHIAFNVEDVYATSAALEKAGVTMQKRPDEGRMKGLAFCLDPDGYWIELCARQPDTFPEAANLSQTMIRVKDLEASVAFVSACERACVRARSDRSFHALD